MTAPLNEGDVWTKQLNLLHQVKINWDILLSDRVNVFVGPSFNIIVSKLYDSEIQAYGSSLIPYPLFSHSKNGRNIKMWIGCTAGLRF